MLYYVTYYWIENLKKLMTETLKNNAVIYKTHISHGYFYFYF